MWQFAGCKSCRRKIHRGQLLCPVCLAPQPHRMVEGPGLRTHLMVLIVIVILVNLVGALVYALLRKLALSV